jgi:hypothetical protein
MQDAASDSPRISLLGCRVSKGKRKCHCVTWPVPMELWSAFLQYGLPALLAGVVVKLAAPWVRRTIERRRLRLKHRHYLQQLVNDLRNELHNRTVAGSWMISSLTRYTQIRPYLRPEVRQALEAPRSEDGTTEERTNETMSKVRMFEEDLTRIEKEWDLI